MPIAGAAPDPAAREPAPSLAQADRPQQDVERRHRQQGPDRHPGPLRASRRGEATRTATNFDNVVVPLLEHATTEVMLPYELDGKSGYQQRAQVGLVDADEFLQLFEQARRGTPSTTPTSRRFVASSRRRQTTRRSPTGLWCGRGRTLAGRCSRHPGARWRRLDREAQASRRTYRLRRFGPQAPCSSKADRTRGTGCPARAVRDPRGGSGFARTRPRARRRHEARSSGRNSSASSRSRSRQGSAPKQPDPVDRHQLGETGRRRGRPVRGLAFRLHVSALARIAIHFIHASSRSLAVRLEEDRSDADHATAWACRAAPAGDVRRNLRPGSWTPIHR